MRSVLNNLFYRRLPHTPLWRSWGLVTAVAAAVLLGTALMGFQFPWRQGAYLALAVAAVQILAAAIFRLRLRDGDIAFLLLQHMTLVVVGPVLLLMLLYLGKALALPLRDAQLIAVDRFFGLDWMEYFLWLVQYPRLSNALDEIYALFLPEVYLVVWLLALTRRTLEMQRFTFAYLIAILMTVVIASLWPAVGAHVFYDIHPEQFQVHFHISRVHEQDLLALRSGELTAFPMVMKGLVTFPSFHVAGALLMLWASWPIRYWREISLILNALIILSSIASGGHYFADIGGGILVGLAAIYLATILVPKNKVPGDVTA